MAMNFECDWAKSAANLQKHGIDFEEAQILFNDPNLLQAPVRTVDEPRYQLTGMIGVKHWSAVITYRGESIRLISVRRARNNEIKHYENAQYESPGD